MKAYKNFKQKMLKFKSQEFSALSLGFAFGLMMRSDYLIKDHPELTGDSVNLSHSLFTKDDIDNRLPLILITQNAEDNDGNSKLDYLKYGLEEHEYILKRAIEFERPDYSLLFVIGLIRGALNSKELKEEEFLHLLELLPHNFLKIYRHQVVEMCNYFDEIETKIKIEDDKIELIN